MITDQEIDRKAGEFGISPNDVEKDYIYGWLLNGIYAQSRLGSSLVLKGGNGLRKAYLPNTRFSKDLDFSLRQGVDQAFLENELKELCSYIEQRTGVHFSKDRTVVKNKDVRIGVDVIEARIYFKGFYGDETLSLKCQLDITQFDSICLPIQERKLLHPYSDIELCSGVIRCQKIEEILASKLTALLRRKKAADLFDLLYSIVFTNEFPVNRLEVIATFLKKSIFELRPFVIRDQLLALPLDDFKPIWAALVAPAASLFNFDYVVSNFRFLIQSLFELIPLSAAPRFPGSGDSRATSRANVGARQQYAGPSYFSWGVRNVILAALQTHTLVELVYGGWRRLVEPYRIEYYVRKSDGVGSEYFWGYDTTGGNTGPSIKSFFCDKIELVRATNVGFVPRG